MIVASPVLKGWFEPGSVQQRNKRRTVLLQIDSDQAQILDAAIENFGRHERVPLTFAVAGPAAALATIAAEATAAPKPPTTTSAATPPPVTDPVAEVMGELVAELKALRGEIAGLRPEMGALTRVMITIKGKFGL